MPINCWLTNRDLLSPIRGMVQSLQQAEAVGQITIVDCDSTYPPLLGWYQTLTNVRVIRDRNLGHHAVWQHCRESEPYFASDGDLDLSAVPRDFLVRLRDQLLSDPHARKVGLALRLDDLPDHFPHKTDVLRHEGRFWQPQPVARATGLEWHSAPIDTTAAVYRSGSGWAGYEPAWRLGGPYAARHLAWYLNPQQLPEEWRWYLSRLEHPERLSWSPRMKNLCRL